MSILMELLGAAGAVDKFGRMNKYAPVPLKRAVRQAAALQAKAMKSGIKSRSGLLAKSIGSKVSDKKTGVVRGIAGPRRGFKTTIVAASPKKLVGSRDLGKKGAKKVTLKSAAGIKTGDVISATRYAHLAEDSHRHLPGGGRTAGQGFKKKAFEQTKGACEKLVKDAVREIGRA